MAEKQTFNILLAVTGSVASIKLLNLITEIKRCSPENVVPEIRVVSTNCALHFFDRQQLPTEVRVYTEEDEWNSWSTIGDPVLHIELRRWAHILVIAPLDANTMAKLSNGLCDNLLTCVVRAWDASKPLVFCPAMNTFMWEHPITNQQLEKLKSFGYQLIAPISKTLACKDTGMGAMAQVETIAQNIWQTLGQTLHVR